jgi:hypothetical protein
VEIAAELFVALPLVAAQFGQVEAPAASIAQELIGRENTNVVMQLRRRYETPLLYDEVAV